MVRAVTVVPSAPDEVCRAGGWHTSHSELRGACESLSSAAGFGLQ